jgi:CBS domain containing-hemolysin-like protein
MERPRDVLVTILMLNVLANILVQNTVSSLFENYSGWGLKVGLPLALTLIFSELLPKSLAMPNNAKISEKAAPVIAKCSRFLGPIRRQLTRATNWISRFFFLILQEDEDISPEELKHVLKTSEKSGVLLKQESQMIGGALDLQLTPVSVLMRPREEILYYDLQEPLSVLLHLFADQQITRIPVCDNDLENIKGVLSASAFFLAQPSIHETRQLLPLLSKPYFVPETSKAFTVFKIMRERSTSLAIVVDEYGIISGLLTQEDLIEKVVGEIADRRDVKSLYTRSGEDIIIASGKMEIAEFKDIFGTPLLSKEHAVTLGGWLIEQLGSIPQTGTQYATDEFLFYVLAAEPNRVRRVYVRRLPRNQ